MTQVIGPARMEAFYTYGVLFNKETLEEYL